MPSTPSGRWRQRTCDGERGSVPQRRDGSSRPPALSSGPEMASAHHVQRVDYSRKAKRVLTPDSPLGNCATDDDDDDLPTTHRLARNAAPTAVDSGCCTLTLSRTWQNILQLAGSGTLGLAALLIQRSHLVTSPNIAPIFPLPPTNASFFVQYKTPSP